MENKRRMYTEVYTVLSALPNEYLLKIPMNIRNNIAENADTHYLYKVENLLPESKAMLIELIRRYCDNEIINSKIDQFIDFYGELIKKNSGKDVISNKKNYNKGNDSNLKENKSIIEYKPNCFLKKLLRKILKIFKK